MTADRPGFDAEPYRPLVLSDALLALVQQLDAGVPRQQALTASYTALAHNMTTRLGRVMIPPPPGLRHGSDCLAELCDALAPIFTTLSDCEPNTPEAAAYLTLMRRLSWQVETVRRVVLDGMSLGHAARHALDAAEGHTPGRKGRRGPLDHAWVLEEFATSRAEVDNILGQLRDARARVTV